jgi:hypothetical protein
MKKYRLLMKGRNFLINADGKQEKHGFHQNIFIDADSPRQAELSAASTIWHDEELQKAILNPEDDPPVIQLDTIWELDILDDVSQVETGRTFFIEKKKWWKFW